MIDEHGLSSEVVKVHADDLKETLGQQVDEEVLLNDLQSLRSSSLGTSRPEDVLSASSSLWSTEALKCVRPYDPSYQLSDAGSTFSAEAQGSPSSVASSRGGIATNIKAKRSATLSELSEEEFKISEEAVDDKDDDWEQALDEASGCYYWFNRRTEESTWETPPDNLSLEERIAMALGEEPDQLTEEDGGGVAKLD